MISSGIFKEEHTFKPFAILRRQIQIEDFRDQVNYNRQLAGKTVVFTGTLEKTGPALEAKSQSLLAMGAKVSGPVSKNKQIDAGDRRQPL